MYIPRHQFTQSTRHFYFLFFRNYRIICHTLKIFMSRQLNNICRWPMSLFVQVWIIVLRPIWLFTLCPSPAFSLMNLACSLQRLSVFLSLFYTDKMIKWRFVVYHFGWLFLRVEFLNSDRDFFYFPEPKTFSVLLA